MHKTVGLTLEHGCSGESLHMGGEAEPGGSEFKVYLGYIESWRPVWLHETDPSSKDKGQSVSF